jgi:hypothetical protein
MKEKCEAAEVDAGLAPANGVVEDRRENGNTSSGI